MLEQWEQGQPLPAQESLLCAWADLDKVRNGVEVVLCSHGELHSQNSSVKQCTEEKNETAVISALQQSHPAAEPSSYSVSKVFKLRKISFEKHRKNDL